MTDLQMRSRGRRLRFSRAVQQNFQGVGGSKVLCGKRLPNNCSRQMGFLDSGMVIVLFITIVLLLVTGLLLFYDFEVIFFSSLHGFFFDLVLSLSMQAIIHLIHCNALIPTKCCFSRTFQRNCQLQTCLWQAKPYWPLKKQKTVNKCGRHHPKFQIHCPEFQKHQNLIGL